MRHKELSIFYCLKMCKVKSGAKHARRYLHAGAAPILEFIDNYQVKYNEYPTVKRVIDKFKLEKRKVWENGWSLKSIRDEMQRQHCATLIQDTQLKLNEMLVDNTKEYAVGDLIQPLHELFENLTQSEQTAALKLTDGMKVVRKFMTNKSSKVCDFGFNVLDKCTGGIYGKDYILLFANTNDGKSTFATALAKNIALQGKKVLFITLEDPQDKRLIKTMSLGGQFNYVHIFDRVMEPGDLSKARKFIKQIKRAGGEIHFVDSMETRSTAGLMQLKNRYKPDIIILDQLSHFVNNQAAAKSNKQLYEHIHYTSKSLQAFIQQNNIPMIILHQSNRDGKKGEKNEIGMGYGPMQDCDLAMFSCPKEETDSTGGYIRRLKVPKLRDREAKFSLDFYWHFDKAILEEMGRSQENPAPATEHVDHDSEYQN